MNERVGFHWSVLPSFLGRNGYSMRTLLAGGSSWLPTASARWWWGSVVLLVLGLVCTACDTASTASMSPTTTVSGRAPHALAASAWEQIALPAPATDVHGSAVSAT